MTQENKKLLLKELSERLPYGVKVTWDDKHPLTVTPYIYCTILKIDNLPKLLLRPMSSMTEEEKHEVMILWNEDFASKESLYHCYPRTTDFYNRHHFDYRGLIEKSLAIEAPDNMYKIKDK